MAPLKHGQARRSGKSSEYRTWRAMIDRCENPADKDFARYGGRGISVCVRWRESFAAFFADMGQRPLSMSIERVDNDCGYEPNNCRWATFAEQNRNRSGRRRNRMVTLQGRSMCVADAVALTGVPSSTIWNRLKRGLSDEKACSSDDYRSGDANPCQ